MARKLQYLPSPEWVASLRRQSLERIMTEKGVSLEEADKLYEVQLIVENIANSRAITLEEARKIFEKEKTAKVRRRGRRG